MSKNAEMHPDTAEYSSGDPRTTRLSSDEQNLCDTLDGLAQNAENLRTVNKKGH